MHGEQLQLSGSSRGANTRSLTATRTFRVLYADGGSGYGTSYRYPRLLGFGRCWH
jgi:hypothetical protein